MARAVSVLRNGCRAVATEDSIINREQANACLLSHQLSEGEALQLFVRMPGELHGEGWLNSLLNDARKEAEVRRLGAWGTIGWLLRSHSLFWVEDAGFSAARKAVPYASPEILACWLNQWRRPELWLAALGCDQPVEIFPALLRAVLNENQITSSELIAVVVKCALHAAYERADVEYRASLAAGECGDTDQPWHHHEWPTIANSLVEALIVKGCPSVETLITEIMCDYRYGSTGHYREFIDEAWHLCLATHAPEAVLSMLLHRTEEATRGGEAALEAAALITQLQSEARSDRAWRVFQAYLQMPWETWRWQLTKGRLSGLLASCLKELPQPLKIWRQAWEQRNPGSPEGWPVDLDGRVDRHAAAVHLELIGILASLDMSMGQDGKPGIADSTLLNTVGDAIHSRLVSAAGNYEESDGHVLQVYWRAAVDGAVLVSCQRLNDLWVYERYWELTPDRVRFAPLLENSASKAER